MCNRDVGGGRGCVRGGKVHGGVRGCVRGGRGRGCVRGGRGRGDVKGCVRGGQWLCQGAHTRLSLALIPGFSGCCP